jgi:hypothetical protein
VKRQISGSLGIPSTAAFRQRYGEAMMNQDFN